MYIRWRFQVDWSHNFLIDLVLKQNSKSQKGKLYVRVCHFFTFLIWSPSCYFVRFFFFWVTHWCHKSSGVFLIFFFFCWCSTISCTQTVQCWHCCYPADLQKKIPLTIHIITTYVCISILQSRKQDTNETQKDWDRDEQ